MSAQDLKSFLDEFEKDPAIAERLPKAREQAKAALDALDEIQSLRQRVERLEGALRFYADLDDWEDFRADEAASAFDRNFGSKLGADMGRTARAALSPKVQEGE